VNLIEENAVDALWLTALRMAKNGDLLVEAGSTEKTLAAREADVPVFVVLPDFVVDAKAESARDWKLELLPKEEMTKMRGKNGKEKWKTVQVAFPEKNRGFAVEPMNAKQVSVLVTGKGLLKPSRRRIKRGFKELA
jgi:methylthioribose-1-phosphate isomerase